MASGDSVIENLTPTAPTTLAASFNTRAGGSTPAEATPLLEFDASTAWYMDFVGRLGSNYAGNGLTVKFFWMAASATTGVTRWGAAFRRVQDDAEDLDTSQTYDFNETDDTTASASGEVSEVTITFTSGADMDNLAAGEMFILRVYRNAGHANDTMAGNAQLLYSTIALRET